MSPLMQQYWQIKSLHPDKLVFFRMGDFYELFYDDAKLAAPLLGIVLTSRNKKAQDETPMCGIPHVSLPQHVNKLLASGLKVAICEQMEVARPGAGLVKRAVTRILTPGMVYDANTLDAESSHYMSAYFQKVLSFIDVTTGECFYFKGIERADVLGLLTQLPVAEFLFPIKEFEDLSLLQQKIAALTPLTEDSPYLVKLPEFQNEEALDGVPESALLLLRYVKTLGGQEMKEVLRPFVERELLSFCILSKQVLSHLEIFKTYKGDKKGSFIAAIDYTKTPMGARLLKSWAAFPLRSLPQIKARQEAVQIFFDDFLRTKKVRESLAGLGDLERRLTRLTAAQVSARDLLALADSVQRALDLMAETSSYAGSPFLAEKMHALKLQDGPHLNELASWCRETKKCFREEAPLTTREGHMVNMGVYSELDELIQLSENSQILLDQLEANERERTGINSLKIRYNQVFGYYIEVTNTHKDKIPSNYIRKQTLANAERFYTEELNLLEEKVLSCRTKRAELEWSIFINFKNKALGFSHLVLNLAELIGLMDVMSSLAWLALERRYVAPVFNQQSVIDIKLGRHPVIEQDARVRFVANDICMQDYTCMLITGPNMAGKSTLMRQVALTSILAQMGSFVPAQAANLPVFDRIFTRIGASDQLNEGLSTFMVEMKETAEMLAECTPQSLVILDEVGRGTSTFDGMAIAQSILEHLLIEKGSLTFFATHYHELTRLAEEMPKLKNYHFLVEEKNGQVVFLHTLSRGPALKSYGVYVAELAGIPKNVIKRAKNVLKKIESEKVQVSNQLFLLDDNWMNENSVGSREELEELKLDLTTISQCNFFSS